MHGQSKEEVAWPKGAWRLRLRLSAPALDPPAVQYGVFSEDPRGRFASDLRRVEQLYQRKLAEMDNQEKRQALRRIQLSGVWSHLFRTLRGDQVYLLVPPCSETALMSNAPAGVKWLVTKPVEINGRSCCWSVPFEAVPGEEVEIILAESNLLDLDALDKGSQP